jgi:negative regulator of replication initiation
VGVQTRASQLEHVLYQQLPRIERDRPRQQQNNFSDSRTFVNVIVVQKDVRAVESEAANESFKKARAYLLNFLLNGQFSGKLNAICIFLLVNQCLFPLTPSSSSSATTAFERLV